MEKADLVNGLHRYLWYKETKGDNNLKGHIIREKSVNNLESLKARINPVILPLASLSKTFYCKDI